MRIRNVIAALALASVPVSVIATPALSGAATRPALVTANVAGHFDKFTTKTAFTLTLMHGSDKIQTDAMTHVYENGNKISLHSLRHGWVLSVRGIMSHGYLKASRIIVNKM